tara:strand:+ start:296 stop:2914 length:2619 start_codon:yes stop_codon:yes gene_type:complete
MDVGFVGFNTYSRPDQLPSGMLADSSNGRLGTNGEWQVRKGINAIKAPFASGDAVLRLPTAPETQANPPVICLLPTTIRSASLASDKVLIVVDNPAVEPGHIFVSGNTVVVEGLVGSPDPNGAHVLTAVTDNGDGTKTIEYDLVGSNVAAYGGFGLTLPFSLDDGGTEPQLTTITTSPVIGFNMVFDLGSVSAVYASTSFSDPNQDNSQFIILASNINAVATNLNDTSISVTMGFPDGENVPPKSSMLQSFNKIFIFRDGQTALENDNFFSPILITSSSIDTSSIVTVNTTSSHNLGIGNAITISGLTGFTALEDPNGTFVVATVPDDTSFTYVIGSGGSSTAVPAFTVDASSIISPGFKFVKSGTYSQPVPMDLTSIDYVEGIATATASATNVDTLLIGDVLTFTDSGSSTYDVGEAVRVRSIDSTTTFTFTTDKEDGTNKNGTVQKPVSIGLGFTHMPAPEYGTYHQRRLVVPFKYSVDASKNTFKYRNILDEVIVSDVLDADTYDQIYAQYRFNAGTSDFNVSLHSFSDDNLLVFNRNSIHLVQGIGAAATVQLITDEVGCVARQSIIQVGNNVLFLSDNGVYGANFQDLYNLRGNEVPLSSPINSIIQRINRDVWDKSVGVYFDNRYYLAVPLNKEVVTAQVGTAQIGQPGDSNFVAASSDFVPASTRTETTQVNNAILIFNFINKQWESIDTTNAPNWNIANLIVAGKKSDRAVYAVNTLGGLHRLDARVDATDILATTIPVSGTEAEDPYSIPASVTTRQFTLGSMDRKRWNNLELHVQSSPDEASNLNISAELENLDTTIDVGTLSALNSNSVLAADEDVSVRGRIGNKRAYGMQVTLNNTVGRPRFRGIKVGGAEAFRSTNTAI